ncbi:MAG TPA: flagellar hook-basal body complex protein [Gemmataceae bacterium]|nr:flagellar hook-basal body complex protein [Gemmataceae bacterium]
MSNILYSGVSGLKVHQDMLNVVGNNLANMNTTGYKSQNIQFSDLIYQTLRGATQTVGGGVGGVNPEQVGSGVQVASITANLQQGSLETTGNELDMALQGNGYFVVNNGVQNLFTRAGAFGVDSTNFLVDPATGAHVQRFGTTGEPTATNPGFQVAGNNNIKIPFGSEIPGRATTTVTMEGRLPANALGPVAQTLTSAAPFQAGGAPATSATLLNSLDDNGAAYAAGDRLHIQGTTSGGTAVDVILNVSAATTLANLLSTLNSNFTGSTASLDASGNLVVQDNATGPSKLALSITDMAGNVGSTSWSNHTLATTATGKDGDMATTGFQFFDTQGTPHTMTLTFQKQAANTWSMTGSIPTADGTLVDNLVSGITFNDNGSLKQVSGSGAGDAFMTISLPNLSQPQKIGFDFGANGAFNGMTQVGTDASVAATKQDGYSAGFLNTVLVDKDGTINGVFTNGQVLQLAQLAIANFANPGALSREGDNYLSLTSESGAALIGGGLSGGRGSVQQKQLENSNVDVALEFTKLIIAQRGYQVNARAITTANEVLQELANILH